MEYFFYKLLHIFAVVLFLGNIITGLFWMHIAVKTKNVRIIHHTMSGIIRADRYFTLPGVVIIIAAGVMAAITGRFPLLRTGWIFWSLVMFSISGIAFSFKVAPLQKKIYQLTQNQETPADFDWATFQNLYIAWDIWGFIALVTPLAAFVMMTLKIPQ